MFKTKFQKALEEEAQRGDLCTRIRRATVEGLDEIISGYSLPLFIKEIWSNTQQANWAERDHKGKSYVRREQGSKTHQFVIVPYVKNFPNTSIRLPKNMLGTTSSEQHQIILDDGGLISRIVHYLSDGTGYSGNGLHLGMMNTVIPITRNTLYRAMLSDFIDNGDNYSVGPFRYRHDTYEERKNQGLNIHGPNQTCTSVLLLPEDHLTRNKPLSLYSEVVVPVLEEAGYEKIEVKKNIV